jgi:hypothetical protein
MTEAFPLQWPDGWPRTAFNLRQSDKKFGGHVYGLTMGRARDQLLSELRMLGARDVVVSSNVPLRRDGLPYSDQRRIEDPGVAVYFMLKKRPLVMARDRFISVAGNARSLALAVQAMRQLARHGDERMMERAFTGSSPSRRPAGKSLGGRSLASSLNGPATSQRCIVRKRATVILMLAAMTR